MPGNGHRGYRGEAWDFLYMTETQLKICIINIPKGSAKYSCGAFVRVRFCTDFRQEVGFKGSTSFSRAFPIIDDGRCQLYDVFAP